MRWPWGRNVERRESFTNLIVNAIAGGAAGGGSGAANTAALEAAAGAVSRGFAAASIQGAPERVQAALSPATLALIGRDLIRRGECLFQIEIQDEALKLFPVGSWDVAGPWDEAEWVYRCDLFGPSGNVSRFVPSAGVVHCRYSVDPSRPWHGIGPLGWAALSGRLHAGSVSALSADMNAISSTVIPMPPGENAAAAEDDPLADLKSAITSARGKSVLVETVRGSFGGDHRDAPSSDWQQRRLGPTPDATLAALHDSSAFAVLSACGVDPTLAGLRAGDGTLAREVFRRFERLTLQPLARIVESELAAKLEAPDLEIGFNSLRASDFAGVARAFKGLIEAGLTPQAAAEQLDMDL